MQAPPLNLCTVPMYIICRYFFLVLCILVHDGTPTATTSRQFRRSHRGLMNIRRYVASTKMTPVTQAKCSLSRPSLSCKSLDNIRAIVTDSASSSFVLLGFSDDSSVYQQQPTIMLKPHLPSLIHTNAVLESRLSPTTLFSIKEDLQSTCSTTKQSSVLVSSSPSANLSLSYENLWTIFNLALWYIISAYYNIYNKRALSQLPLPWTMATIQMGTGMLIFIPMWWMKIRQVPATSYTEWRDLSKTLGSVATFTTLSHIAGVMSLGLGSVSFVQVVKAAEPLFTAFFSMIWMKEFLPVNAYLSMIPVIVGVVIASVSELRFSWSCLVAGILSNLFAGARGVLGKLQLKKTSTSHAVDYIKNDNDNGSKLLKRLSPANYYSVLTMLSFLICVPLAVMIESHQLITIFNHAITKSLTFEERNGLLNGILSGLMHYLYNEMSFRVLANMNPVSHALANTVKRVAVIALSVIVFQTQISRSGKVGSVIAIVGALLYSLVRK